MTHVPWDPWTHFKGITKKVNCRKNLDFNNYSLSDKNSENRFVVYRAGGNKNETRLISYSWHSEKNTLGLGLPSHFLKFWCSRHQEKMFSINDTSTWRKLSFYQLLAAIFDMTLFFGENVKPFFLSIVSSFWSYEGRLIEQNSIHNLSTIVLTNFIF